jgi:PIN domain nuclease of toxin-antitoxin system
VEALPVTADVAIEAGRLPESFPGDPVDRLAFATAVSENALLVTRDERITAHDPARVVW